MINEIMYLDMSSPTIVNTLICFGVALILGIITAVIYMYTTTAYSKHLVITIAVLPAIVQVVLILVFNVSIVTTVAILGIFRLIRFRSLPGNSKEIMAVFLSATIGLAVGLGYLFYASILTAVIGVTFIVFNLISFGEKKGKEKLLKVLLPENLDYTEIFDDIFDKYLKKVVTERVKTVNMGTMFEVSYVIVIKDPKNEKKLIDEIRTRNGNLTVSIGRVPFISEGM